MVGDSGVTRCLEPCEHPSTECLDGEVCVTDGGWIWGDGVCVPEDRLEP